MITDCPQLMTAGNPYMPPLQNFVNPNAFGPPSVLIAISMATWQETILSLIKIMALKREVEAVVGDRCLCFHLEY